MVIHSDRDGTGGAVPSRYGVEGIDDMEVMVSDVSFEKRLSALEARVYAEGDLRSAVNQEHAGFESSMNMTNLLIKEMMVTQSEQKMMLQSQGDRLTKQNFLIERRTADIEAYGDVLRKHSEMFEKLDRKILVVDGKVDALDGKVNALDGKVEALDGKVNALDGKVDAMGGEITVLRGKVDAVDGKLDLIVGMLERSSAGSN